MDLVAAAAKTQKWTRVSNWPEQGSKWDGVEPYAIMTPLVAVFSEKPHIDMLPGQ